MFTALFEKGALVSSCKKNKKEKSTRRWMKGVFGTAVHLHSSTRSYFFTKPCGRSQSLLQALWQSSACQTMGIWYLLFSWSQCQLGYSGQGQEAQRQGLLTLFLQDPFLWEALYVGAQDSWLNMACSHSPRWEDSRRGRTIL